MCYCDVGYNLESDGRSCTGRSTIHVRFHLITDDHLTC